MRVEIFNVGHGSAGLVVADNQNIVLLDCGHDDGGFRPSKYLPRHWKAIQNLVVSHYDSDHVSDLGEVAAKMPIQVLFSNPTITVEQVRRLKQQEGPLTTGMQALLSMKSNFGPPGSGVVADLAGVRVQHFYHSYSQFQDMNNLSVVTFIDFDGFGIVFPGDLERAGWQLHLQNLNFRQCLARTNVFGASHHGRENGYCEEVFSFCKPELVVISDTNIQHETQEHSYDNHAKGMEFVRNGVSLGNRYVLTTRSDGHIVFEKNRLQPLSVRYGQSILD
jgi:beta-lactamase superfamily II metal-dependent hydrolase